MTLHRDPGPGVGTYTSTLWSVTVGGLAQYTWGKARTTAYPIPGYWNVESVEVALSRYQSDETQLVRVTLLSGPITSVVVYPRRIYDDRTEIQGGVAVISVPPNGKAVVVVNGVRKYRLHISADPIDQLTEEELDAATVYDGTNLEAAEDEILYFAPGVYNLTTDDWGDKLFPIKDGATVYMALGSWVIGTFDLRLSSTTVVSDVTIRGGGNLSGEFTTWEVVVALPTFTEQFEHTMVFAYVTNGARCTNTSMRGVTLWQSPLYAFFGLNSLSDCAILNCWNSNTDAVDMAGDPENDYNCSLTRCHVWCGDDACKLLGYQGNITLTDNIIGSTTGASLLFSGQELIGDWGYDTVCTDNTLLTQAEYQNLAADLTYPAGREYGMLVRAWADSPRGSESHGRFRIVIDGLYIEGDTALGQLFNFGTRAHPWTPANDQRGQISNIVVRNVQVETTPSVRSIIRGTNRASCANGIHFENVVIGGVRVTARNFADYFDVEEECFNITIDGRAVA